MGATSGLDGKLMTVSEAVQREHLWRSGVLSYTVGRRSRILRNETSPQDRDEPTAAAGDLHFHSSRSGSRMLLADSLEGSQVLPHKEAIIRRQPELT
jgi:hypothetical protein